MMLLPLNLLYIGPGIAGSTIILVFVVLGIVALSFGFIFYLQIKELIKKFRKKKEE